MPRGIGLRRECAPCTGKHTGACCGACLHAMTSTRVRSSLATKTCLRRHCSCDSGRYPTRALTAANDCNPQGASQAHAARRLGPHAPQSATKTPGRNQLNGAHPRVGVYGVIGRLPGGGLDIQHGLRRQRQRRGQAQVLAAAGLEERGWPAVRVLDVEREAVVEQRHGVALRVPRAVGHQVPGRALAPAVVLRPRRSIAMAPHMHVTWQDLSFIMAAAQDSCWALQGKSLLQAGLQSAKHILQRACFTHGHVGKGRIQCNAKCWPQQGSTLQAASQQTAASSAQETRCLRYKTSSTCPAVAISA